MTESLIHTTENNNSYIYDRKCMLSMLAHPDLVKVYEKKTNADPYYSKKYEYLKEHGFFAKLKPTTFAKVTEAMVKKSLIETPRVMFEVTDSCNLSCTYCAYGELYEGFDVRNHKNIDARSAKKLLKYIFDLRANDNNELFIGFYGGEPLLNMKFIKEIVGIANHLQSEKNLDIKYSITTNATLIHKHIGFFADNRFVMFISLDGNEQNHSYRIDSRTKKNSFQKVVENLDMVQRDYPEYFINYIYFNTVLHDKNSVKDIYAFIYKRYHKVPRITELALDDISSKGKSIISKMYHSIRKSEAEYQKEESTLLPLSGSVAYLEAANFLDFFSINSYISNMGTLLNVEKKYFPTSTCLPFQKVTFMTNRNKLLPCEAIDYKYSMGEVNDDVEIDISKITRQYNFYYDHLKNTCQYCYIHKYCGVCMFSIKNLDKLDTEKFVCNGFHDQKTFQNKLHGIFSFLEKYRINYYDMLISKESALG